MNLSYYTLKLDQKLKKAVKKGLKRKKVAVLFSGALDSSIVVSYLLKQKVNPTLFSLYTKKARDLEQIKKAINFFGLKLLLLKVSNLQIIFTLPKVEKILEERKIQPDFMQLSLTLSLYLLAEAIKKQGFCQVFSGYGADSLFAGFAKHQRVSSGKLNQYLKENLPQAIRDYKKDQKLFKKFNLILFSPFMDKSVIEFSLKIPANFKIKGKENKIVLRKLAQQKGLPDFIAQCPKGAFQYTSGVQKLIEKILKRKK